MKHIKKKVKERNSKKQGVELLEKSSEVKKSTLKNNKGKEHPTKKLSREILKNIESKKPDWRNIDFALPEIMLIEPKKRNVSVQTVGSKKTLDSNYQNELVIKLKKTISVATSLMDELMAGEIKKKGNYNDSLPHSFTSSATYSMPSTSYENTTSDTSASPLLRVLSPTVEPQITLTHSPILKKIKKYHKPISSSQSEEDINKKSGSAQKCPVKTEVHRKESSQWTLKYQEAIPGKIIELIDGSGVFVDRAVLNCIIRSSREGKTLARRLLELMYTPEALKTCSLSGGKSKNAGKPTLNQYAKNVMMNYIQIVIKQNRWSKIDDREIENSLRCKLEYLSKKL